VFEYECLAPADYLRWLLETPAVLSAASLANFSEDGKTYRKRASLFGGDPDTQEEAIRRLAVQGRRSGKGQWHVLEGSTMVDCALFCESLTVFIEGKRTEPQLTDKTEWYEKRNQVVRNLDCLRVETNRAPAWFVLLIVEAGTSAEKEAAVLDQGGLVVCDSLPHLSSSDRDDVWSHYLGFTTWQALAARFGLPTYPDKVGDIVAATPRG
jgi:hypothetical protein